MKCICMHTYQIQEKSMGTDPWLRKQRKSAEDVFYDNSRQKVLLEALKCQMLLRWTGGDDIIAWKFPTRKVVGYLSAS